MPPKPSFAHEKFDVYQLSLQYVATALEILDDMPSVKGKAALTDQLVRASFSIPLNIAEGAGRFAPMDKRRFYLIASGSVCECAAVLDVFALTSRNIFDLSRLEHAKELLLDVSQRLMRLCKSQEDRAGKSQEDRAGKSQEDRAGKNAGADDG